MENKKIGMAINYNYHDYGGILQAYASFKKIKDLGYEPEAINIDSISSDIKRRKIIYFINNIFDISIVREKSQIILKKIRIKTNKKFKNNISKRDLEFEKFSKSHFIVSREYKDWEDLRCGCESYSSVVVGSDQLWLPSNIAGDYYTLSFVPDNINKIAYATSFGVSEIPEDQKKKTSIFLKRINYLSAREKSGQRIIKEITGRRVQLVCDPALLLTKDEWEKEINKKRLIRDEYIFCYFMGNNLWHREFVKKLKNITGYKVVALLHLDQYIKSDESYADITPFDISPDDFINLVKYSKIVCTDSFHGTVFSLIFEKKFFTFMRFSDTDTLSTNSRISTLLNLTGCEDRLVSNNVDVYEMLSRRMNNKCIQDNLNEFRRDSLEYLKRSLERK